MNTQLPSQNIQDSVVALKDQGVAAVDAIKSRIGELNHDARGALHESTSMIQEHPLKAIGVAFGIGYLAMRIRTSPLFELGVIAGIAYLGSRIARR